jgi:hypothetical protein
MTNVEVELKPKLKSVRIILIDPETETLSETKISSTKTIQVVQKLLGGRKGPYLTEWFGRNHRIIFRPPSPNGDVDRHTFAFGGSIPINGRGIIVATDGDVRFSLKEARGMISFCTSFVPKVKHPPDYVIPLDIQMQCSEGRPN